VVQDVSDFVIHLRNSDTDHLETVVLLTVSCQSLATWVCLPKMSRSKFFSKGKHVCVMFV